jgi:hypothetical protein
MPLFQRSSSKYIQRSRFHHSLLLLLAALSLPAAALAQRDAAADSVPEEEYPASSVNWDLPVDTIPDLRRTEKEMVVPAKRSRNFFLVPIPMSSPTFGAGLIVGGAYYYPQSIEEKAVQPASFTGAAAGYTTNSSRAAGVMHQQYWGGNRWRFNAVGGYADLRLELVQSLDQPDQSVLDWVVSGNFIQTSVSRRVGSNWFIGATARYLDITQDLDLVPVVPEYSLDSRIEAPGIGINAEFDSRDVPASPWRGLRVEFKSMVSDQRQRSDGTYLAMYARVRGYHRLRKNLVLAWDVNGCQKSGSIPLWDTCRLNLRGFPVTDYLSKQSLASQVEARWRLTERWGAVAFAGGGLVDRPFAGNGDGELIPSYGVGVRFAVLPSQRVNLRLDYGRSNTGAGAWYLAVGEAF